MLVWMQPYYDGQDRYSLKLLVESNSESMFIAQRSRRIGIYNRQRVLGSDNKNLTGTNFSASALLA